MVQKIKIYTLLKCVEKYIDIDKKYLEYMEIANKNIDKKYNISILRFELLWR